MRNNNMATNLHVFTSSYDRRRLADVSVKRLTHGQSVLISF